MITVHVPMFKGEKVLFCMKLCKFQWICKCHSKHFHPIEEKKYFRDPLK